MGSALEIGAKERANAQLLAASSDAAIAERRQRRHSQRVSGCYGEDPDSFRPTPGPRRVSTVLPSSSAGCLYAIPLCVQRMVPAVFCVNTVGRPALFSKLTAVEKESVRRAANVAERILLHVDKNEGFSVDGRDRMEDQRYGLGDSWAGLVLGLVNTGQKQELLVKMLEAETHALEVEELCITKSNEQRKLMCKLLLSVFALSDFGGNPEAPTGVGIMDWVGKLKNGVLNSDPKHQQETWEIVIRNTTLRAATARTQTLQMWMRHAPHQDRPATMFVFDEVRDFVYELLLGVTMDQVLELSQAAGLVWEWVQCRLSVNAMHTEKAALEDEERERDAAEELDNCFTPCAYSEHQAYVDAPVEDEVVQGLLARAEQPDSAAEQAPLFVPFAALDFEFRGRNRRRGLTLARIMAPAPAPATLVDQFVEHLCLSPHTVRRSRMAEWATQAAEGGPEEAPQDTPEDRRAPRTSQAGEERPWAAGPAPSMSPSRGGGASGRQPRASRLSEVSCSLDFSSASHGPAPRLSVVEIPQSSLQEGHGLSPTRTPPREGGQGPRASNGGDSPESRPRARRWSNDVPQYSSSLESPFETPAEGTDAEEAEAAGSGRPVSPVVESPRDTARTSGTAVESAPLPMIEAEVSVSDLPISDAPGESPQLDRAGDGVVSSKAPPDVAEPAAGLWGFKKMSLWDDLDDAVV